jgi:hypothetical protein
MPRSRGAGAAAIRKDVGMGWTAVRAAGAALIAALVVSACAAGATGAGDTTAGPAITWQAAASPDAAGQCYALAVNALRRHVIVRRRPAPCAGLTQAQINEIVGRAIRTVVGPYPKAVARRLAAADSRYLGSLVRAVPPPPAASTASAQPTLSGQLGIRLAALAAWLLTAIPGAYLLTGWLARVRRRRLIRKPGVPSAVPLGHATLALTGLCIWIAFTATGVAALAWAAVGLTWIIAGLGMATLLSASPEQQVIASTEEAAPPGPAGMSAAAFPVRAPVIIIAVHGALATLTILLVLLAAVGIG